MKLVELKRDNIKKLILSSFLNESTNNIITTKTYHISNTQNEILHFIPSIQGIYGWGVYTTPNLNKIKKHFYDIKSKRYNGRVYLLNVSIQNPIDEKGLLKDGSNYWELIKELGPEQAKNFALNLGHTGVIRKSTDGTEIILPFSGDQITILDSNVIV